ncbi:MAG: plastocyanin/azurin family copper-binding protein [Polyangiales bacterium]
MRAFVLTCGLLAIAACGDDADDDNNGDGAPVGDSGTPVADSSVDAGHDHGHDLDASASDATVVVDAAPDPSCSATISLQDFKFVPANPTVTSGAITLCARNDGRSQHDLVLRGSDQAVLGKTETLDPGETGRFQVTVSTGSYVIFCSLPGHESLGMKGTVTAN